MTLEFKPIDPEKITLLVAGGCKYTNATHPDFKCRQCQSNEILFYVWESSDGAHEDIHYFCTNCSKEWWVEAHLGEIPL